jgi:hypothetical protein
MKTVQQFYGEFHMQRKASYHQPARNCGLLPAIMCMSQLGRGSSKPMPSDDCSFEYSLDCNLMGDTEPNT